MEINGKSGKKTWIEKFKENSRNLGKPDNEKAQKIQIEKIKIKTFRGNNHTKICVPLSLRQYL